MQYTKWLVSYKFVKCLFLYVQEKLYKSPSTTQLMVILTDV